MAELHFGLILRQANKNEKQLETCDKKTENVLHQICGEVESHEFCLLDPD